MLVGAGYHSTDIFIIGMLTEPTKTRIDKNLSAFSLLLKDHEEIRPKYIINKIGSIQFCHPTKLPHVGIPQIEPEIRATV